jgi:hypothetical protein
VYNGSALADNTVVLNETVLDLVEDQLSQKIYCKTYNIDLSLLVIDYFGQPIAHARIDVERDDLRVASPLTGQDGTASLEGIIGGDCRLSVYVLGALSDTRSLYLDGDRELVFQMSGFAVIGGYTLKSVQFVALISLIAMIATLVATLTFRSRSLTKTKKKAEDATTKIVR